MTVRKNFRAGRSGETWEKHAGHCWQVAGAVVRGVNAEQGADRFEFVVTNKISSRRDKRLRFSRDYSVRIPTLKLPFWFRVQ
jgi:hypothetical protein